MYSGPGDGTAIKKELVLGSVLREPLCCRETTARLTATKGIHCDFYQPSLSSRL